MLGALVGLLFLLLGSGASGLASAQQPSEAATVGSQQPISSPLPGSDADCISCHVQAAAYGHTAHAHTSSRPTSASNAALLQAAGTRLDITGPPLPLLEFLMQTTAGGALTQTAVTGWPGNLVRRTEPVDVVVGSDRRGQTFLSWTGDRLFELPVSYWKDGHRWINSPGYIDGTADFSRPVQPGCLECHFTAAHPLSDQATTNSYQRESLVDGIGCRTCHGDGTAHAVAERAVKSAGTAVQPEILNPAHFSRDRQIDLCALCHSGIDRTALAPAFSYVPGQPLAEFFRVADTQVERPDVHGNQVGLLERSPCFRGSPGMTCSTCHDVHTTGRTLAAYASRCLTCHRWQSCGEAHRLGASIQTRCIECHMPLQPTEAIVSVTAGDRIQATMRTHWIKVYPAIAAH